MFDITSFFNSVMRCTEEMKDPHSLYRWLSIVVLQVAVIYIGETRKIAAGLFCRICHRI